MCTGHDHPCSVFSRLNNAINEGSLYFSLSFSEHHGSPVGPTDTNECSGGGVLMSLI